MATSQQSRAQAEFRAALLSGESLGLDLMDAGADIEIVAPDDMGRFEYDVSPFTSRFHSDLKSVVRAIFSCFGAGTTSAALVDAMVIYPELILSKLPQYANKRTTIVIESVFVRDTLGNAFETMCRSLAMLRLPFTPIFKTGDRAVEWSYVFEGQRIQGRMLCLGMDDPDSVGRLQGRAFDQAVISEPMGVKTEYIRLAVQRSGRWRPGIHPRRVIIEGNPPEETKQGFYGAIVPALPDESELGIAEPRRFGKKDLTPEGIACFRDYEGMVRAAYWCPGMDSPVATQSVMMMKHDPTYLGTFADDPLSERRWKVMGLPGTVSGGDRVARAFAEGENVLRRHPAPDEVEPRVVLASDTHMKGAMVFAMLRKDGGLVIVDECPADDVAADVFGLVCGERLRLLGEQFPGLRVEAAVCDPAGRQRGITDGRPYYRALGEAMSRAARIPVIFSPLEVRHNTPSYSVSCLSKALRLPAPAGVVRALQMSPACRLSINALNQYSYKVGATNLAFDKRDDVVSGFGDAIRYLAGWMCERYEWADDTRPKTMEDKIRQWRGETRSLGDEDGFWDGDDGNGSCLDRPGVGPTGGF